MGCELVSGLVFHSDSLYAVPQIPSYRSDCHPKCGAVRRLTWHAHVSMLPSRHIQMNPSFFISDCAGMVCSATSAVSYGAPASYLLDQSRSHPVLLTRWIHPQILDIPPLSFRGNRPDPHEARHLA